MPAVNRTSMPHGSADPITLASMSNAAGVSPLYDVNLNVFRRTFSNGPLGLAGNLYSSSKDFQCTKIGGAYRNRTDDILLAKQALSHLS
jgi:hypothetical protein